MDKAAQYLCIARKAGLLVMGEDACSAAVAAGKARLMALASDASANTVKRAGSTLQGHRALLAALPWTKDELAGILGKSCAVLCMTDLPLAARFASALAESLPEWRETASILSQREDKAARRRAAGRKHDSRTKRRT